MSPKLIDPLDALREDRAKEAGISAGEAAVVIFDPRTTKGELLGTTHLTVPAGLMARAKADFRVFLTIIWRSLLGCSPNPIQLDMAYWLQHGPDRAITMAFRGFSKSWITGAYALWRLLRDPDEKILVVSGSLSRAAATTNWCLHLILTLPILAELRPKPSFRQSSLMFDVGNCVPQQSASFMAMGIGGQLVGFRGTCIIADDVETQTNSLTVVMREKIRDAVKEFESVLTPGGVIKYLGTPHDADSLYTFLLGLRDKNGRPVYRARIWPALFPDRKQIKSYGDYLAPYIITELEKRGPEIIGHTTMPQRFPDEDLEQRRAAMGSTEFNLQFMLDLRMTFSEKYPLKLKNLIVMDIDPERGHEDIAWGNSHIERDLPVMGFDGDFYYGPAYVGPDMAKWERTVGFVDTSGSGSDELALSVVSKLMGRVFWRHLFASREGSAEETLDAIAEACVLCRINLLIIESNFGGETFMALLKPRITEAWKAFNSKRRPGVEEGGTQIELRTSGKVHKEKRILNVLEPITQNHRLVVSKDVLMWDANSLKEMEGEHTRRNYAFGYQFTHLTSERDCLPHDDRVESLSGACAEFALELGINPKAAAAQAKEDRAEEEMQRLMEEADEVVYRDPQKPPRKDNRPNAVLPQARR